MNKTSLIVALIMSLLMYVADDVVNHKALNNLGVNDSLSTSVDVTYDGSYYHYSLSDSLDN